MTETSRRATLESVARYLRHRLEDYPTDVFPEPPDGALPYRDCVAAHAMRHILTSCVADVQAAAVLNVGLPPASPDLAELSRPVGSNRPVIPGTTWKHYKGGTYTLLAVAETHEHTGERDCVYVSHTNGKIFTRPLQRDSRAQDSWNDLVVWPDGERRSRFVRCDDFSAEGT